MFGNLITNRQLQSLIKSKVVEIVPFNVNDLSLAHYTLHVGKVLAKLDDGTFRTIHNFSENSNPYIVKENEYIIVEIDELIKLNDDNIIGHFIPASNLIKDGISIMAGKIDKKYGNLGPSKGHKPEMIQFGFKNNLNEAFSLTINYRVAHLALYDLRGVASEKTELSESEKLLIAKRFLRALDAGPNYEEGND